MTENRSCGRAALRSRRGLVPHQRGPARRRSVGGRIAGRPRARHRRRRDRRPGDLETTRARPCGRRRVEIDDLDSMNGTWVNGRRIKDDRRSCAPATSCGSDAARSSSRRARVCSSQSPSSAVARPSRLHRPVAALNATPRRRVPRASARTAACRWRHRFHGRRPSRTSSVLSRHSSPTWLVPPRSASVSSHTR